VKPGKPFDKNPSKPLKYNWITPTKTEHRTKYDTSGKNGNPPFAGQTVPYKQVPFQRVAQGSDTRITGAIPAKLSDFKIDPPSLLTIPVKNEMPVRVDVTRHPM
jgi:hypothetical protein